MKKLNVAVVGATGAVGQEILKVLAEREFPINGLKLLASQRSAGKEIQYQGKSYIVEETTHESFQGVDIALFAGGSASKEFARSAAKAGCVVIDNSSAFRLEPDVPLVVPEVNPEDVKWHKGIIANPNCSTIQMVVALNPLHQAAKIKRVVVSTYQAVSGAGIEAIEELTKQTQAVLAGEEYPPQVFPYPIAFNLIPHIDVFEDMDYTKEEWKMVRETKKILHDDNIAVTATTVRVPVYRSHSESINIETERKLTAAEAREILRNSPGIIVVDNVQEKQYPMPLFTSNRDEVFVGRIREDNSLANGLNLWVVADQLRKGAATNAVQIAELLVKYNCI
ncbi:aspartate-semialdehyde dehydrogenase [Carboxydocella sporoproducens DSM 16521]|uniref:Aspartate-semialdehyde dehydrogenase n=2 Tax=Carboxydocella TaxID=178898 RepID=A0A1T4P5B5_9FIRM|nr:MULTISPECIES: aspartate-semialdehyde dehydrogenase [Carboxydocella]AVX20704.1 aspartate-semialdehyde dehydrogenase [Carboxydocella thermautotrophica]AVX31123.1 aspartate-semialdehyde dehydrogenase [Carboxydocella thermautotrophica]SJZ86745.1 aspartate-semialdehyde dehydrogenase [Carboxydocella sporoproducens DSM 16521]